MERLTKRISGYAHGAEGRSNDNLTGNYCRGKFESTACIDKLADYEDAEESGLMIKLPVAIGGTVYIVNGDKVEEDIFYAASVLFGELLMKTKNSEEFLPYGEKVFLTKEEAEKALEKMENEKVEN